jgi:hypothetical protein
MGMLAFVVQYSFKLLNFRQPRTITRCYNNTVKNRQMAAPPTNAGYVAFLIIKTQQNLTNSVSMPSSIGDRKAPAL